MKKMLMLIACLPLWFVSFGQINMYVKCIHIGYNVSDSNKTYGFQTNLQYDNPRIKLDLVIDNNDRETMKFDTNREFPQSVTQYEYRGENIRLQNAAWMSSGDEIPIPFVEILPGESYAFSLSFELHPTASFTTENYLQNFWSIIPTLSVTITQDKPQPLVLKSEPITWQNLSVCNDKQRE